MIRYGIIRLRIEWKRIEHSRLDLAGLDLDLNVILETYRVEQREL